MSSNFHYWIRKYFEKIKILWKIVRPKFFQIFLLEFWVKKIRITLSVFISASIFSDRRSNYHYIFIFIFCRLFLKYSIMKIFRKSSPKFFIMCFLNSHKKSGRITCEIFRYLFGFRMSTDMVSELLMKFTTLGCTTGNYNLTPNFYKFYSCKRFRIKFRVL